MPLLPPSAGAITIATVTDPAAGADVTFQTPLHERWRIHAIAFSLITDANVATRLVRIEFYEGLTRTEVYGCALGHVAATTWLYNSAESLADDQTNIYPHATFALPTNLVLLPETIVNITTAQKHAGDQFYETVVMYESWINP